LASACLTTVVFGAGGLGRRDPVRDRAPKRCGRAQLGGLVTLLGMLTGDSWRIPVHGGATQLQWFDFEAR
jgi:hypothetical protein